MRMMSCLLTMSALIALSTAPALAGSVSYTDMKGKWTSTRCEPPKATSAATNNPETAANDLNAQRVQASEFVNAANAYMLCISEEAQRDAEAASLLVTKSAQMLIDKTQAQIDEALGAQKSKAAAE